MSNSQPYKDAAAERARNSVQSNKGQSRARDKGASDSKSQIHTEETALLGDAGSSSGLTRSGTSETEWAGHADFEGLTWWHKPSIFWLLPPFGLFFLAFGGTVVPKLNLILSLICRQYLAEKSATEPSFIFAPVVTGGDNPQCRLPEIQALATKFTLYLTIIAGVLSAVMAPKLGALSDRYGRINFMVITSAGGFLTEIITILAAKYPDTINYSWLLAGSAFEGLCGSFTAGMALSHAYATDCTAPQKRAVAFAYFHACLFSGIALGPFIAAFTFKATGSLLTMFYAALVVHACFILFIFFVVPESLTKKRQMQARERFEAEGHSISLDGYSFLWALRKGNVFAPLKVLWPTGPRTGHLRANLILLSIVDTIIFGTAMGAMTVVVYYSGFQFNWGTYETNLFVSVANTTRVSALLLVLPLLNYILRSRRRNKQRRESGFVLQEPNSGSDSGELFIVRLAVLLELSGFAGYALSRTPAMFALSGILAAFGGIGSPTLQSALTKHVSHEKVGQLLGATGLLHALARIVCPLVFNLIYASTVGSFPQAVFVVLTGCFGVAFLVSWFVRPNIYVEETESEDSPTRRFFNRPQQSTEVLVDEEIAGI